MLNDLHFSVICAIVNTGASQFAFQLAKGSRFFEFCRPYLLPSTVTARLYAKVIAGR